MTKPVTARAVQAMKGSGKAVVCVTAYDYTSGLIADQSGVDVVLVGDSLGSVILGRSTTVGVTPDDVAYHVRATRAGVSRALLVADMPFGSYGGSVDTAVDSAVRFMRAGAQAVKLEGVYVEEIRALVKMGVPVMGHLGMTPQSVNVLGGHRVQGRGSAAQVMVDQARALEEAGVFSIVLELTESDAARQVTEAIGVPTIGIGSGPHCDGQIQVFHDLVGLYPVRFRHAKAYASGKASFTRALKRYVRETRDGVFPGPEHSF